MTSGESYRKTSTVYWNFSLDLRALIFNEVLKKTLRERNEMSAININRNV